MNIVRVLVNVLPAGDQVNAIPVKVWATTAATRRINVMPVAALAPVRFVAGWGNAIFVKALARKDGDNYFV